MIILSVACLLICRKGRITPWLGMGWISIYTTAVPYRSKCMLIYVISCIVRINFRDKYTRDIKSKKRALNTSISITTYEEKEYTTMHNLAYSAKYIKNINENLAIHINIIRYRCKIKSCKWAFKSHTTIQTKKLCVKFYVVTTQERSHLHKRLNKSPPRQAIFSYRA